MQTQSTDNFEQFSVHVQPEINHSEAWKASNLESSNVIRLNVSGMKCAGCVSAIEKKLKGHPSVADASVNLVTAKATVLLGDACSKDRAIADELSSMVTNSGFPTTTDEPSCETSGSFKDSADPENSLEEVLDLNRDGDTSQLITQQDWSLAIAAVLLILSLIGHLKHLGWITIPVLSHIWFHCGLATVALLWPGRPILLDGWRSLRHGIPNMNTLVGMGMATSYSASLVALLVPSLGWECFFDEPVMLVGFILMGRTLENRARMRAKQAIEALFSQQPQVARLLNRQNDKSLGTDGSIGDVAISAQQWIEIPTQMVQVGQWLKVLPGDQVPVDGTIISGRTSVNEAILTGESLPIEKGPGDRMSAGSLNQSSAVIVQATQVGRETTLSKMIQLVEAAQTRKAPVQKLADTVAGYFAYGVMAIAALTFIFWYGVGTHLWPGVLIDASHMLHPAAMDTGAMGTGAVMGTQSPLLLSLKLAIAVLVIACPCALGLATPTAIMVGSGIGAERGLLIRGGDVLEHVHRLDTVVFDKTGTLTTGQPTVTQVLSLDEDWSDNDILALAAEAEKETQHPIGQAIQRAATERSLAPLPVHDVQTEVGFGLKAWLYDAPLYIGKPSWLRQHLPWDSHVQDAIDQAETNLSGSSVLVALETTVIGIIGIDDQLRADAQACIRSLQSMNIQVKVLTGDRWHSSKPIVESLGLPDEALIADVQPGQKSDVIHTLQQNRQVVCMVGDGINDAPALAQADVAIALHSGTDVAIETSDIVLMRDRLIDVAASIALGRRVIQKVRQNLFWALAYNTLGIPIAAGVLLPKWGILLSPANAGALMAFSSVSVVVNALLLRRQ